MQNDLVEPQIVKEQAEHVPNESPLSHKHGLAHIWNLHDEGRCQLNQHQTLSESENEQSHSKLVQLIVRPVVPETQDQDHDESLNNSLNENSWYAKQDYRKYAKRFLLLLEYRVQEEAGPFIIWNWLNAVLPLAPIDKYESHRD